MDAHDAVVAALSLEVRQFYDRKQPFRVHPGYTNSTLAQIFCSSNFVAMSSLNQIISADNSKKAALFEPNIPMDALVAATVRHGLIPPVVMEYCGINVGSSFADMAGEVSSFKYCLFDCIESWV